MNVFLSATSGMKDKVKFRSLTTRIDISHNILCLSHRIEIQTFQRKEKKKKTNVTGISVPGEGQHKGAHASTVDIGTSHALKGKGTVEIAGVI